VAYTITLPVFEGPLDLLLRLIRQHKLEISEVSLVAVSGQYLDILHALEEMDLEVAGEFLVVAATLMEIKSRSLLPTPEAIEDEEGEDPAEELLRRLEEYEQFRDLSERLWELESANRLTASRAPVESHVGAVPLADLGPPDLTRALRRLLIAADEAAGEAGARIAREGISLSTRLRDVWAQLTRSGGRVSFSELLPRETAHPRRQEVLATFLVVLELVRLGQINVWQDDVLEEILLQARSGAGASLPAGAARVFKA